MTETDFLTSDYETIMDEVADAYEHLCCGGWLMGFYHSSPIELFGAYELDMRDCVLVMQIGVDAGAPIIMGNVRAWARKWSTSHPIRSKRKYWKEIANLDEASLRRVIEAAAYADEPGPNTVKNLHLIESTERY